MKPNITITYQRIEGAAIFMAALYLFRHLHFSLFWLVFPILVIDISMLGYLINNQVGAHIYNIGHSYLLPAALLLLGVITEGRLAMGFAIIWIAHIGIDRALGFGLKLPGGFQDTHLGKIGRRHHSD
jgi:hypothetical protein